jgi:hypothetical protein
VAFGPEGAAPERYSLDFDALLAAPADGDASGKKVSVMHWTRLEIGGLSPFSEVVCAGAGLLQQEPRFSLIDGGYHGQTAPREEDSPSSALSERVARSLSQRAGAHTPLSSAPRVCIGLLMTTSYGNTVHAGPGQLAEVTTAAEYLTLRRAFQGLETPYTGAAAKPVTEAVEGRSGRAAGYEDEPETH